MARKAKVSEIYTVRNGLGQFLGTYRAYNADQAIQRCKDEISAIAHTFRKSCGLPRDLGYSAKVEISELVS